jgi:transposase InsO family protein
MSRANWSWGAPRIHGKLLKLGIEVAQSTVAKYMVKRPRRPGQNWATFLRNQAAGIAATDLFVVPTISFKLLYCLVVLAHGRRKLVHHAVTAHPTSEWVARQMTEAFPWDTAPKCLVRDRDAVYGHVVRRRLRALGIRDRPTAPRSPWQNAYVERLIGSIRRESTDQGDCARRDASSSDRDDVCQLLQRGSPAPVASERCSISRPIECFGRIIAEPMVGGLHHRYTRI